MLDKQLAITEETAVLWRKNTETMKALKEAAVVNEAGIVQSEANYYMILASIGGFKESNPRNGEFIVSLIAAGSSAYRTGENR